MSHTPGRLLRFAAVQGLPALPAGKQLPEYSAQSDVRLRLTGPGMKNLSADFRCNIDTMMVESSCLSSIWETDEVTENYYKVHGRREYFKTLKAVGTAYYDSVITVDLSKAQSMIAMPFHPSNVYTIHEFQEHAEEIFASVEREADELFGRGTLSFLDKVKVGKPYADQGSVAGCAGGLYENLMEMAAILDGASLGNEGFNVTAYPSSMLANLALSRAAAFAMRLLPKKSLSMKCRQLQNSLRACSRVTFSPHLLLVI